MRSREEFIAEVKARAEAELAATAKSKHKRNYHARRMASMAACLILCLASTYCFVRFHGLDIGGAVDTSGYGESPTPTAANTIDTRGESKPQQTNVKNTTAKRTTTFAVSSTKAINTTATPQMGGQYIVTDSEKNIIFDFSGNGNDFSDLIVIVDSVSTLPLEELDAVRVAASISCEEYIYSPELLPEDNAESIYTIRVQRGVYITEIKKISNEIVIINGSCYRTDTWFIDDTVEKLKNKK